MKKVKPTTIILFGILIAGVSLLLYPTVANWWNSFHQTRAIASYMEEVEKMSETDYGEILQEAADYNARLYKNHNRWHLTPEQEEEYFRILDITGTGIMGYIEIPDIDVQLSIYHGTDEGVLQIAVGHMEGSSLPVGGINTHCVLSGHRGLPSAKLFTDLDKLNVGQKFIIRVLNEKITYQIDNIVIVEPEDITPLAFEEGEDLCSLVTCTPLGINSHRIIVTGHRVESDADTVALNVNPEARLVDTLIVASLVAVPILFALFVLMMVTTSKKKEKGEKNEK